MTICIEGCVYLLGEVVDGEMQMSDCGWIVGEERLHTAHLCHDVGNDYHAKGEGYERERS